MAAPSLIQSFCNVDLIEIQSEALKEISGWPEFVTRSIFKAVKFRTGKGIDNIFYPVYNQAISFQEFLYDVLNSESWPSETTYALPDHRTDPRQWFSDTAQQRDVKSLLFKPVTQINQFVSLECRDPLGDQENCRWLRFQLLEEYFSSVLLYGVWDSIRMVGRTYLQAVVREHLIYES
ncbi:MAG: hypothetical protein Q8L60_03525 [Gammaproteobacteria bacterium]|nr:hypothetical protein [Gammaproteobacteria bacterium]MDP2139649.1 hypothetical protein [Gammaproteobacteria bacterium]MDP2348853.1 hypothetical protein [Gammaproteobacteria bacterium]